MSQIMVDGSHITIPTHTFCRCLMRTL